MSAREVEITHDNAVDHVERDLAENLFLIVQRYLRENLPHVTTRATLCVILGKFKPCFLTKEAREFIDKTIKELNYEYTE